MPKMWEHFYESLYSRLLKNEVLNGDSQLSIHGMQEFVMESLNLTQFVPMQVHHKMRDSKIKICMQMKMQANLNDNNARK